MVHGGSVLLFVLVALLVIFFFRRWRLLDVLIEEINNLRGGPPTGIHPSPSDDAALLRKRSKRQN